MKTDEYDFMHCKNPICDKKIRAPWTNIQINRDAIRKGKETVPKYKCPYCAVEFTADDGAVISVPCPGVTQRQSEKLEMVFVQGKKIVGFSRTFVLVDKVVYAHVNAKFIKHTRAFLVERGLSENDLAKAIGMVL